MMNYNFSPDTFDSTTPNVTRPTLLYIHHASDDRLFVYCSPVELDYAMQKYDAFALITEKRRPSVMMTSGSAKPLILSSSGSVKNLDKGDVNVSMYYGSYLIPILIYFFHLLHFLHIQ